MDPRARAAVATDGTAIAIAIAIAIVPFPEGFTVERHRFIPAGSESLGADAKSGVCHAEHEEWGWEAIEEMATATPPIYQIIIEPARLLALCQAMGTGWVMLEFTDADCPVKVSSPDSPARRYLMPAGGLGLLFSSPPISNPSCYFLRQILRLLRLFNSNNHRGWRG